MDHATGADEVCFARWCDESGWEDVNVVGDAAGGDGVAGIISSLSTTAVRGALAKDVDQFAFPLVACNDSRSVSL